MSAAARGVAADTMNAQQRMDGPRGGPTVDRGGRPTAADTQAPRADKSTVQNRRLFAGPGAPFGQSAEPRLVLGG